MCKYSFDNHIGNGIHRKTNQKLKPEYYIKLSYRHNSLLRIRLDVPKQISE